MFIEKQAGTSVIGIRNVIMLYDEIDHCTAFGPCSTRGITPSSLLVCGEQISRQRGETAREPKLPDHAAARPCYHVMLNFSFVCLLTATDCFMLHLSGLLSLSVNEPSRPFPKWLGCRGQGGT